MKIISNKELKRWYIDFNRRYFSNRLPKDAVVRFEKLAVIGSTKRKIYRYVSTPSECRKFYRFTIVINKKIQDSRSLTLPTLLHEMIHIEHWEWKGHGPRFQKRMLKLAKAGAFNGWW